MLFDVFCFNVVEIYDTLIWSKLTTQANESLSSFRADAVNF